MEAMSKLRGEGTLNAKAEAAAHGFKRFEGSYCSCELVGPCDRSGAGCLKPAEGEYEGHQKSQ